MNTYKFHCSCTYTATCYFTREIKAKTEEEAEAAIENTPDSILEEHTNYPENIEIEDFEYSNPIFLYNTTDSEEYRCAKTPDMFK